MQDGTFEPPPKDEELAEKVKWYREHEPEMYRKAGLDAEELNKREAKAALVADDMLDELMIDYGDGEE